MLKSFGKGRPSTTFTKVVFQRKAGFWAKNFVFKYPEKDHLLAKGGIQTPIDPPPPGKPMVYLYLIYFLFVFMSTLV